ncbi:hypothetical protein [Dyella psychrodurans]|uniref:Uncharacterized protein n=1 Tax=Dyella psychrodurans TaxID=1927960 RepID=A0A370X2U7_9GAMM|nr:hypothetical protein [Dyella psychrodurans]RDS82676.1 hypothetical protein DWU99_14910 [Dyella psychrodurans]
MRATPLLLASVLSLGTIASASATGTSTAGTSGYNCTNQSGERSASRESASTGGDTLNIPRASSATRSATSSHASSSSSTDESATHLSGADATSSGSAHSSGLGWQSLLPGSIQ